MHFPLKSFHSTMLEKLATFNPKMIRVYKHLHFILVSIEDFIGKFWLLSTSDRSLGNRRDRFRKYMTSSSVR